MESFSQWDSQNQLILSFILLVAAFVLLVLAGMWIQTWFSNFWEAVTVLFRGYQQKEELRDEDITRITDGAVRRMLASKTIRDTVDAAVFSTVSTLIDRLCKEFGSTESYRESHNNPFDTPSEEKSLDDTRTATEQEDPKEGQGKAS
jgi:hypothetical protein